MNGIYYDFVGPILFANKHGSTAQVETSATANARAHKPPNWLMGGNDDFMKTANVKTRIRLVKTMGRPFALNVSSNAWLSFVPG